MIRKLNMTSLNLDESSENFISALIFADIIRTDDSCEVRLEGKKIEVKKTEGTPFRRITFFFDDNEATYKDFTHIDQKLYEFIFNNVRELSYSTDDLEE